MLNGFFTRLHTHSLHAHTCIHIYSITRLFVRRRHDRGSDDYAFTRIYDFIYAYRTSGPVARKNAKKKHFGGTISHNFGFVFYITRRIYIYVYIVKHVFGRLIVILNIVSMVEGRRRNVYESFKMFSGEKL